MVANLTTPLIGIVSTTAIGRLGDATLLGGVAMDSVVFDWLLWLVALLRMSAEAAGLAIGGVIAQRLTSGHPPIARAHLFERDKLMRMISVNRDIMIRTASLILVWLFFAAQGARAGDVALAANAILNNFLLVSAFFLDGLANAAEQLCGRAYGARARDEFTGAVRLVVFWGFGFALAVTGVFALFGPALIDFMTASPDVRRIARDFLLFVVASPALAVFAFAFDGVYIG